MRIHCIRTGTAIVKASQRRGKGHGARRSLNVLTDTQWTEPLPIHAWAIEHPEGVIVVDTGQTARAAEPGYYPRWHLYYRLCLREQVRPEEEIGPQLRSLAISPTDVRWVVLTHLHPDHAGGLCHFPEVEILVSRAERKATAGLGGRINYVPNQFPSWFSPRSIDFLSQPFGPFPQTFPLTQTGDVLLVATPGHTPGHLSVIVKEADKHVFIAGDTSYTEQLMIEQAIDGISPNEADALQTLERIRQFVQDVPTVYVPTHDLESAERLAN